jgi:hypothetical protein
MFVCENALEAIVFLLELRISAMPNTIQLTLALQAKSYLCGQLDGELHGMFPLNGFDRSLKHKIKEFLIDNQLLIFKNWG